MDWIEYNQSGLVGCAPVNAKPLHGQPKFTEISISGNGVSNAWSSCYNGQDVLMTKGNVSYNQEFYYTNGVTVNKGSISITSGSYYHATYAGRNNTLLLDSQKSDGSMRLRTSGTTFFSEKVKYPSKLSNICSCYTFADDCVWGIARNQLLKVAINEDNRCTAEVCATIPLLSQYPAGYIVTDGDNLWTIPSSGLNAGIVQIRLHDLSSYAYGMDQEHIDTNASPFGGAAYDGRNIWMTPNKNKQVIKFDTVLKEFQSFDRNKGANGNISMPSIDYNFVGAAFDGRYVWTAPVDHNYLIRIDTKTGRMKGFQIKDTAYWANKIPTAQGIFFTGSSLILVPKSNVFGFLKVDFDGTPETDEIFIREEYRDLEDNMVQPSTYLIISYKENYHKLAPRIEGYKRIGYRIGDGEIHYGQTVDLNELTEDICITFLYAPLEETDNPIQITERFIDEAGRAFRDENYLYFESGSSCTRTAPDFEYYTYLGYQLDNSPMANGREITLEQLTVDAIITYVYRSQKPITISEEYINNLDGSIVQPKTSVGLEFGEDYMKLSPKLTGWKRVGHRIDGEAAVNARTAQLFDVQSDHTVTFLYEPCDGEHCQDILITESYYDVVNDSFIQPDTYEYLYPGDDYEKTASALSGYRCVGHRVDGGADSSPPTAVILSVQDDHHVVFLYEPAEEEERMFLITEQYYDRVKDEFIPPDTETLVKEGDDYAKAAPAISGYRRVGHRVDGGADQADLVARIANVMADHVVTFLYEPREDGDDRDDDLVVVERYYDVENNRFLRPNTYTVVGYGMNYRKTAPSISRYRRVGHRVDNGAVLSSLTAVINNVVTDHVVVFFYEPIPYGGNDDDIVIIESYYDQENDEYIRPDTYTLVLRGNTYRKTAPVIAGFKRVGHNIDDGPDQASLVAVIDNVQDTHHVTFLYEPGDDDGGDNPPPGDDEVQIVEQYYDVVNDRYIRPDTYTNVKVGSDYQKTAPSLSGYQRLGHQIDGGIPSGSFTARINNVRDAHVVTFLYRPDDGTTEPPEDGILITERYYDTKNRRFIRPNTYTKVARGSNYAKTAPAISGYFRVGHNIDGGADQTAIIAVIQNVQQSHVVTFLYEPTEDCDDFVIVERYYDVKNEEYIRPNTETLVEPGADYSKTAPEIEGYERVGHFIDDGETSESLTAVILNVREDHIVTFLYEPEDDGKVPEPGPDPDGGGCCCCCCCQPPVININIHVDGQSCCSCGDQKKQCKPCPPVKKGCSCCCKPSKCDKDTTNDQDDCK